MSVTARLCFDPTDANTIASSHSVGAYVRAGTDGNLIGSETLNSLEWLRVAGPIIDSAGNEVGVTSNALDVNIAAASGLGIFAEDSAHTSGDDGQHVLMVRQDTLAASTSADGDYGSFKGDSLGRLYVTDDQSLAELESIDTRIENLSHAEDAAHSSGDLGMMPLAVRNDTQGTLVDADGDYAPLQVDSDGRLRVVTAVDIDDDLADTAIENTATAVSLAAVNAVSSALANRKWMYLANEGNITVYFGKTGVTTANGFPLHCGQQSEFRIGPSVTPQLIGATGASSEDIRVMELS